jgi:predicted membrane channel-forming protein YqfA (hemolysin III family)
MPFKEREKQDYDSYQSMFDEQLQEIHKKRGAGGTSGGVGSFLIGLAMAIAGGYLFLRNVNVSTGYWTIWGYNGFGMSLFPLLAGIGTLFFNGKSKIGWLLTFAGAIIIFVGIIASLNVYFATTNLFNTLTMLILLVGGIGLIARSLKEK